MPLGQTSLAVSEIPAGYYNITSVAQAPQLCWLTLFRAHSYNLLLDLYSKSLTESIGEPDGG